MKPSQACLDLIKHFEGCSLIAYPDPASPRARTGNKALSGTPWTIGYGTTGAFVHEGLVISPGEASRLLQNRIDTIGALVVRCVPIGLSQGQLDALTSLCYNIGQQAFRGSTLLRLINERKLAEAANELLKWNHAGGKVMPGLTLRREAERALFTS